MTAARRVGWFTIPRQFIEQRPDLVRQVMARCVIIKADYILTFPSVAYVAICDDFDEVDEGCAAPGYTALFDTEKGFIGWKRTTPLRQEDPPPFLEMLVNG